jgi:hypothetical protein
VIHDFSKPWFPQKPHRLEGTEIELNGIKWTRIPGVRHKVNYYEVFETIMNPPEGADEGAWEREQYRHLFLNDLWALVYFGLRVPVAYHKFWIQACWEVQDGPRTNTLDIWAREHGKSTIITVADSIHRLLRDPNERIALFSYSKPAAQRFVRQIKWILEDSAILKACFPDIFYENPAKESPKWSEEVGLVIKRSTAAAEPSISGHGLLEGMPTGSHFSRRLYDDIEVHDFVNNPDVITKLKESFDMSQNLGTVDGTHGVTGTPYHHFGLLQADHEIDEHPESSETAEKRGEHQSKHILFRNNRMLSETMLIISMLFVCEIFHTYIIQIDNLYTTVKKSAVYIMADI